MVTRCTKRSALRLLATLLTLSFCFIGCDDKKESKEEAEKEGIDLATGDKPKLTAAFRGVQFGDSMKSAKETMGIRGDYKTGKLEGFSDLVHLSLGGSSSTGEVEKMWVTFPAPDSAPVKKAFKKAWGKSKSGKSDEYLEEGLKVGKYQSWFNPKAELEVRLFFHKDEAVLLYRHHLELSDIVTGKEATIPPQFGFKLGDKVDSIPKAWRDGSKVKTRRRGGYQFSAFAYEGVVGSFTVALFDKFSVKDGRKDIEKIWGKGTDAKSKMKAPIVVWQGKDVTATLDQVGRLELEKPKADE